MLWKIFQSSTNNRISFVYLFARFQLQSVMCICNLCCQNPTEQGVMLSLLTISFKRSVGFFEYWSSFFIVTWSISSQGMTIRTARLPGAGNLLGRAGEDLSGQDVIIFLIFLLTVSYFNSSTRFRVTLTVFVLRFRNRNISFLLHHQTDRLQCRSMWLACQCS